jgi:hypothetical protein
MDAVSREAIPAGLDKCTEALLDSVQELRKLDSLHLLTSILKKILCIHTLGLTISRVMEDHIFDGQYLVKRDTFVRVRNKSDSIEKFATTRSTKDNS